MNCDKLIATAKIAEQAERFDDMATFMEEVTKAKEALNTEERNLLSVAYKNVIGEKLSSWRVVKALEEKQTGSTLIKAYREKIEEELKRVCDEVLKILNEYLIKVIKSSEVEEYYVVTAENAVFFLKMKGDYVRYKAEVAPEAGRHEIVEQAEEAYQKAHDIAEKDLPATNPIRLGLTLNFSVFYYELKSTPEKACELAKKAFDQSISGLDSLPEDSYKDSTLIMQLLRDNLNLWSQTVNENEDDNDSKE